MQKIFQEKMIMKNPDQINNFINRISPINQLAVEDLLNNQKTGVRIEDALKERINKFFPEAPPSGFYITQAFQNTIKEENIGNIYEKILPEKSRKRGGSYSDTVKFDDQLLKETANSTNNQATAYCNIVFPLHIDESSVLLLYIEILKIPFDFNFFFFSSANNPVTTTPKINNEDLSNLTSEGYAKILKKYLENEDFQKSCYNYKIFKIEGENLKSTYSDFIIGINDKFKSFADSSFGQNIKIKVIDQQQLAIELPANGTLQIKNKKENQDLPKIYHNATATYELKYWENFLSKTVKKVDNQQLKFANYIDVSFECSTLKPFIFSNNAPGFHVIEYLPQILYTTFSNTDVNSAANSYINIFEVYKALFINKIIEINLDKIDL